MRSETNENYWHVFLRPGELVVAPFGLGQLYEPVIVFKEFKETNEDD
jgi:hypothetical protein